MNELPFGIVHSHEVVIEISTTSTRSLELQFLIPAPAAVMAELEALGTTPGYEVNEGLRAGLYEIEVYSGMPIVQVAERIAGSLETHHGLKVMRVVYVVIPDEPVKNHRKEIDSFILAF